MMRNAADEYGSMKIRFNAVRPGFIATEIMEVIPRDSEIFKSYVENIPLGEVGKPEDVASLVKFLLTSESSWITGQIFTIDAGTLCALALTIQSFLIDKNEDSINYGR